MVTTLGNSSKKSGYGLLLGQTVVVFLLSFIVGLAVDKNAAISALKGGLIILITNFIFVRLAFHFSGASNADKIYAAFMLGQALKILLTAGLCAFVLQQPDVQPGWFFLGFIVTLMVQWSAPIFFKLKT